MTRPRRLLHVGFALGLTVMVNGLGLAALLGMNRRVAPAPAPAEPRVVRFDFQPPPKEDPEPRPRRTRPRAADPRQVRLAPPKLPSTIQARRLRDVAPRHLTLLAATSDVSLDMDTDLVMTEETVDAPPRVLRRVPPRYPSDAAADGVEGQVSLRLLVNREGQVEQVRVETAEPSDTFEEVARRAVSAWRFAPATFGGAPVSVWVRQRLVFELD
jgi:periplasmic protein TonB